MDLQSIIKMLFADWDTKVTMEKNDANAKIHGLVGAANEAHSAMEVIIWYVPHYKLKFPQQALLRQYIFSRAPIHLHNYHTFKNLSV